MAENDRRPGWDQRELSEQLRRMFGTNNREEKIRRLRLIEVAMKPADDQQAGNR